MARVRIIFVFFQKNPSLKKNCFLFPGGVGGGGRGLGNSELFFLLFYCESKSKIYFFLGGGRRGARVRYFFYKESK